MRNTTAAPSQTGWLSFAVQGAAAGCQGNHYRVVARQNDVDPDDLEQADPEVGVLAAFPRASPVL
jgi:hypothetical protein